VTAHREKIFKFGDNDRLFKTLNLIFANPVVNGPFDLRNIFFTNTTMKQTLIPLEFYNFESLISSNFATSAANKLDCKKECIFTTQEISQEKVINLT